MLNCFKYHEVIFCQQIKMGSVELVLFSFNALLVVTIIAVIIRIYYLVEQQGVQISVLLKH